MYISHMPSPWASMGSQLSSVSKADVESVLGPVEQAASSIVAAAQPMVQKWRFMVELLYVMWVIMGSGSLFAYMHSSGQGCPLRSGYSS